MAGAHPAHPLATALTNEFIRFSGGSPAVSGPSSTSAPAQVANPIPGGGEKVPNDIGSGSSNINTG